MTRKVPKPTISNELIEYLDSIFPEKSADLKDTEKKSTSKVGKGQSLII